MKHKDKAYQWWKGKPTHIRKPLVLTLGVLLVLISPFTGILPGPGGIPIFLLGIAILASEYDWADRFKHLVIKVLPKKIQQYWRITPNWLHFFDIFALMIFFIGIAFCIWPLYLPIINMQPSPPFFYVVTDRQQEWWIPVLACFVASLSILLLNKNRLTDVKQFLRIKKS